MIKEFLEHIWPSKGLYCLAIPKIGTNGNNYWAHIVCDTVDEAVNRTNNLLIEQINMYMAVGTISAKEVWNSKKEKMETRTHANMAWFRSLIFDIDSGANKPYATQTDALKALMAFITETGLPIPTVVSSGNGLHVYFTLTTDITPDEWYALAIRLKAIAKYFKLAIDNSRTSDKASILRIAGTFNFKDKANPKPVKILKKAISTDVETLSNIIEKLISFYKIKVIENKEKPHIEGMEAFAGITGNVDVPTADLDKILTQCQQMRRIKDIGGEVGYNLRHAGASIIKCCIGQDYSILLRDHHEPQRIRDQLDYALTTSVTNKPNLCTTFEAHYPEGCEGCPKKGREGYSPISLGYKKEGESLPPPEKPIERDSAILREKSEKIVLDDSEFETASDDAPTIDLSGPVKTITTQYGFQIALPDPPFPYKRTTRGIFLEELNEEGQSTSTMIYQYDVHPYEIIEDHSSGTVFKLLAKMPHNEEKTVIMPMASLVDPKLFNKLLADASIVPATQDQRNMMAGYMNSYINEIQKLCRATKNYPQLGWLKDAEGFVFPNKVLMQDGSEEESGISRSVKAATDSFRKKGTLENWVKVINTYSRPGFEPYAFGHLVGYASVLFRFTGYAGAMVNMVGDSGSGKSTVLQTINSIFGHPTESILMQHDTYNARINRLGVFNSICVAYDEITNIDAEELSNLCYSITQGRGKERLSQNAEVKENNTKWQLVVASTSNSNLMGKLSSLKHDASAESLRVFEYSINTTNFMTKAEAREVFRELDDNYGHAGEIFIKEIIKNQSDVKKLIDKIMVRFDKEADVPNNERYWSAIVACTLAGGVIANKLGLCNYNIESLFKWSVKQIMSMRGIVKDNRRDPRGLLVEFLNTHINNTLVMGGGTAKDHVSYVKEEPRASLMVRNEIDKGLAYISKPAIRAWLSRGGSDYNWVKRVLKESKILLDEDCNKVLTSGSTMNRTGQSKCWLIDLNHNEMAGCVTTTPTIEKDSNVEDIFSKKRGMV